MIKQALITALMTAGILIAIAALAQCARAELPPPDIDDTSWVV